jgi:ABC-type transporter Mla subunit MlaD
MAEKIKSKKVSSPFLIGLFVIIGAAAIIGVVIWLGASQFLKEQRFFVTYFDGSIEGLETGSPVKYLGVSTGSVKTIRVAPDGKLVEVVMQINPDLRISDSLRVKAEMAGIAGGKFLQLFYPDDPVLERMYPVIENKFEPPYPVIKSAPSGIEEIEIAARDVMNKLMRLETGKISHETIGFLQSSQKFLNNEDLYKSIENIQNAGKLLVQILEEADTSRIINNLAQTSDRLLATSNQLDKFADTLSSRIEELQFKPYLDHALEVYDSTMANTNKTVEVVGYRTENVLHGLTETLDEIRKTNAQLRKSLRDLTENPAQMLLSEPPPPEK